MINIEGGAGHLVCQAGAFGDKKINIDISLNPKMCHQR